MDCITFFEMTLHVIRNAEFWTYANSILTIGYEAGTEPSYWTYNGGVDQFCRVPGGLA